MTSTNNYHPFGLPDSEAEVRLLKADYQKLFFSEAPFNLPAVHQNVYLISGRRGSGKTALAHFFSFQDQIPNPYYIDVDEPHVYQEVLMQLTERSTAMSEVLLGSLIRAWEYSVWSLLIKNIANQSDGQVGAQAAGRGKASQFVRTCFYRILSLLQPDEVDRNRNFDLGTNLDELFEAPDFVAGKAEVLRRVRKRQAIIAVDTLEKIETNNENMMKALAALIQFAADFHLEYQPQGLHVKVFVPGEVFPTMKETSLLNPAKSLRSEPIYLLWRPRDLLRLICWRFYKRLENDGLLLRVSQDPIQWDSYQDVLQKMWTPYFGREVVNGSGLQENTWPYILRHTQMRPRQLILICNKIATMAIERGEFPMFRSAVIREGIASIEGSLATEIVNSYSSVYLHSDRIIDALLNMPMMFAVNELDKKARITRAEWPPHMYSLAEFRRLVVELGIVGRATRINLDDGYVDAEFEYSGIERLRLANDDTCVIHPMFYSRLNTRPSHAIRVMPFASDRLSHGE